MGLLEAMWQTKILKLKDLSQVTVIVSQPYVIVIVIDLRIIFYVSLFLKLCKNRIIIMSRDH